MPVLREEMKERACVDRGDVAPKRVERGQQLERGHAGRSGSVCQSWVVYNISRGRSEVGWVENIAWQENGRERLCA